MPGFLVPDMVDLASHSSDRGPNSHVSPLTSYSWVIEKLFDKNYYGQEGRPVFAKDVTLPTFSVEIERVPGSSVYYKYASLVNWDDVRLSFYDIPVGNTTLFDDINERRRRIWTSSHGLQYAEEASSDRKGYKAESIIIAMSPDETYKEEYVLIGSWPSVVRYGELTYTQTEVKLIDLTVSYDYAKVTGWYPGEGGQGGGSGNQGSANFQQ